MRKKRAQTVFGVSILENSEGGFICKSTYSGELRKKSVDDLSAAIEWARECLHAISPESMIAENRVQTVKNGTSEKKTRAVKTADVVEK